MPRIKRWFPVSHDINSDPEVWAMRRAIGEKSLSIWLEILSISDRNESELPGDYEELVRSIAGKCQATKRTVSSVFQHAISRLWLKYDPTLRVANYMKYHKTREPNEIPPGEQTGSLPSEPSEPTLPNRIKNKSQPSFEGTKMAQTLSDKISENFPNRTLPTPAQFKSWAGEADRINRIDKHPWPEVLTLLEWSQADPFWKSNILSMSKFRQQWTQLLAKQAQGADNGKRKGSQGLDTLKAWGERSGVLDKT